MGDTDEMLPCGGCGNANPRERCIGCLHDFMPPSPRRSVTAEPVAWRKPEHPAATEPSFIDAKLRTEGWMMDVFTIPLYAAPPVATAKPVASQDLDAQALDLTKRIEREFYHDHPGGSVQVRAKVQSIIRSALASPTITDEMVERFCKAFEPKLFSDDAMEAHMAASPCRVDFAQNKRRIEIRAALLAALGGKHD